MKKIISNETRKLAGVLVGSWEYKTNNSEIEANFQMIKSHKSEFTNIRWTLEKGGRRLAWKSYFCDTFYPEIEQPSRCEWHLSELPKLFLYNT